MLGGGPYNGAYVEYDQASNATAAIGYGDLVNLKAGLPIRVGATPTVTRNDYTVHGVCVGVSYTDPVKGQTTFAMSLPAGAYTAGYRNIKIRVADHPKLVCKIQFDGPGANIMVGKNCTVGGFSTALSKSGVSGCMLLYAGINTTNSLAVRIVELVTANTELFPEVLVCFNMGVHGYDNPTGG